MKLGSEGSVCGNDGRVVCVYIVVSGWLVESMHSFNKLFRGINFLENEM